MIGFTAPWLLVGLLAAAVPILLHLVQRREPPEVAFPAVRYLEEATRDHRRRVKLRHLLLLAVRTLLIVTLVLAAAGMTMQRGGIGRHAPSALVLVLDNSASSGTVIDGVPVLTSLVRAAREVFDRATPDDRLWLITANGVRSGAPSELITDLAKVTVSPARLDLGTALGTARDLVRGSGRRGEVVMVSDLQQSAVSAARPGSSVLVLRPDGVPPANRSVRSVLPSVQPWGSDGGRITFSIAASDTVAVAVTLRMAGRGERDLLVTPGVPVTQRISGLTPGWTTVTLALPPDELRSDDSRSVAVRVAPPVGVHWASEDRFVAAALEVLRQDGRVRAGETVRLGALGSNRSVVFPPEDPAQIGALNRALAARGGTWRFGVPWRGIERSDSSAILPAGEQITRRVSLEPLGAGGDILATVGGTPWLVRSGDLLLVGSRLDTAWTALPLSAAFMPFLDAVVSRAAQGQLTISEIAAGEALRLPEQVREVIGSGGTDVVEGGALWRPRLPGVYHLIGRGDTLGAVTVTVDPRESQLARAADRDVRALWGNTTVASLEDGPRRAFTAATRGDLRGALLLLALCCALAETGLAGRAGRRN